MDYLQNALKYRSEGHELLELSRPLDTNKPTRDLSALAEVLTARRKARQPLFQVADKYENLTLPEPTKDAPLHQVCKHPLDGTVRVVSYGLGDLQVAPVERVGGAIGLVSKSGPCPYCTDDNRKIAQQARMNAQLAEFSKTAEVPRYARKYSFKAVPGVSQPFPPHLDQDSCARVLDFANSTIAQIKAGEEYQSLFLHGAPGAGKSLLAAMIMRRMMEEGLGAFYVLVESHFMHIQRTFGRNENLTQEERDYEDNILRVPVLVLDDLGTESPTDWVLRKIFTLMELRSAKGLLTIITSNNPIDILAKRWHKKYQDPETQQMSQRIQRRFNDYYVSLFVDGGAIL